MDLQIQEKINARDKVISKLPRFQQKIANSVLSGKRSKEVHALCQAMIKNEMTTFQDLSPKYWCHKIKQKVFLFHGANDSMVPFTESIQLSEILPNSELLISHLYEHNAISTNRGVFAIFMEIIKLINFYAKLFTHFEE